MVLVQRPGVRPVAELRPAAVLPRRNRVRPPGSLAEATWVRRSPLVRGTARLPASVAAGTAGRDRAQLPEHMEPVPMAGTAVDRSIQGSAARPPAGSAQTAGRLARSAAGRPSWPGRAAAAADQRRSEPRRAEPRRAGLAEVLAGHTEPRLVVPAVADTAPHSLEASLHGSAGDLTDSQAGRSERPTSGRAVHAERRAPGRATLRAGAAELRT
jgi:hypothetical protein